MWLRGARFDCSLARGTSQLDGALLIKQRQNESCNSGTRKRNDNEKRQQATRKRVRACHQPRRRRGSIRRGGRSLCRFGSKITQTAQTLLVFGMPRSEGTMTYRNDAPCKWRWRDLAEFPSTNRGKATQLGHQRSPAITAARRHVAAAVINALLVRAYDVCGQT
jgi:hypothetical protein